MDGDFEKLPRKVKAEIIRVQELVNKRIRPDAPEKQTIGFKVRGEKESRRVAFILKEAEDGKRYYEFYYLAW